MDDSKGAGVAHDRRRPKGSECECIGCGEFFGSPSAFDRHIAPVGCRCRKCDVVTEDQFRQVVEAWWRSEGEA